MSEHIDHVLSNYLSANVGYSESEAIGHLRAALSASATFAEGLRRELSTAFADESFPWKASLSQFDVLHAETNAHARAYAKRILWDSLFEV